MGPGISRHCTQNNKTDRLCIIRFLGIVPPPFGGRTLPQIMEPFKECRPIVIGPIEWPGLIVSPLCPPWPLPPRGGA